MPPQTTTKEGTMNRPSRTSLLILLGIIVAAIVAGGAIFYLQRDTSAQATPTPTNTATDEPDVEPVVERVVAERYDSVMALSEAAMEAGLPCANDQPIEDVDGLMVADEMLDCDDGIMLAIFANVIDRDAWAEFMLSADGVLSDGNVLAGANWAISTSEAEALEMQKALGGVIKRAPSDTNGAAPGLSYGEPKPEDFELTAKIVSRECFGSAGCNIDFRIETTYNGGALDPATTYEVLYEVHGVEDGPLIDTLEVTGDQVASNEENASTPSADTELTVKVTEIL